MFRRFILVTALVAWSLPVAAQPGVSAGLNITLEEAERRALDRNPQIAEARLGTDAADFRVAESRTVYTPNLNLSITQRSQTNPVTTQLSGGQEQVTNETLNYGSEISQQLKWGGGRYSVTFDANRAATSNVFSTFNPSFGSGLSATFTQPLLRGFSFDAARAEIAIADINRGIADVQVRQEMATTLNAVRRAYWELVYTVDAMETARRSEDLARQNLEDNKLRVELGTLAAIDVVEAEAEIATRHQAFVQAEGAWRTAQVDLKQLVVKDTSDPIWSTTLVPAERPAQDAQTIDVPAAIATALANRSDLEIARKQRESTATNVRLLNEERKPAVDLVASYGLTGLGGTQILRQTDALGGQIIGTIPGSYFDALGAIAGLDYPTWSVGVNLTVPLGKKASDAAYARGQVEQRQADLRLESLELEVAAAVTRSAQAVHTAQEQIQAAVAASQLAQKRLDAEQARRNAGLSTTFLVLQAQRDLAAAQTSELKARLDYRTALADFDRVQVAP